MWSKADKYLDGTRSNTSPLLMETMIFLKENRRFWNEKDIIEAYKIAQSNLSQRLMSRVTEEDMYLEMNPIEQNTSENSYWM